jgi:4-amino-4-deoxy-L-arabinose transferase-like glycosyltransferase
VIVRAAAVMRERWMFAGLALFVATIWLGTLGVRPLFNPDEGRYAEIPREMLVGGDWVVPHLNGLPYIEKPPLQYWATAASFRLFGQSEFSARLYTALTALSTIAIVWLLAHALWDKTAAWRAAAILASLSLFPALGQLLTLDMSLSVYMTASLAAFLMAQRTAGPVGSPSPGRASPEIAQPSRAAAVSSAIGTREYMLIAWAATACAVLTKGVVAALIPAAVLVLYTAISRDTAPWRRLQWPWGLGLFLALTVPWHWLAARRLPDFLNFFFIHEHFARYLTPVADREEPWWFFGAVFLAGCVPWTLAAVRGLWQGWRHRAAPGEFNAPLFLGIWVVFVFGFFSLSDSKLIPYVLPALPALALLIAILPPASLRRDLIVAAAVTLLVAAVLAIAGLYGPRYYTPRLGPAGGERTAYFLALAAPLLRIAAVLGLSGLLCLLRRRRDQTGATVFLGAGWCLAVLLLQGAAAAVAPIYSGASLAAAIPAADRQVPIYSVSTYDQTLPFYLRRTVTLVAYRGELDYGLRHTPGADIGDIDGFVRAWSGESRAFAVMETDLFDQLKSQGLAMRVVSRDLNRVLVAKP